MAPQASSRLGTVSQHTFKSVPYEVDGTVVNRAAKVAVVVKG
jgi:hypothetical protein